MEACWLNSPRFNNCFQSFVHCNWRLCYLLSYCGIVVHVMWVDESSWKLYFFIYCEASSCCTTFVWVLTRIFWLLYYNISQQIWTSSRKSTASGLIRWILLESFSSIHAQSDSMDWRSKFLLYVDDQQALTWTQNHCLTFKLLTIKIVYWYVRPFVTIN